ncbi:MAG: hypothetical protein NTY37_07665 [Methanothrix sp.]|nr:hypothetical protein [Methanothrix sp.]
MQPDRQIDPLVYEQYALTEEEDQDHGEEHYLALRGFMWIN